MPLPPCSGGNDQSLHWTVSKVVGSEECSLRLILSEHLRSGRRILNFAIMKYINATGRLNPIMSPSGKISTSSSGFTPSSALRSRYKFHGFGKGRPRPILHVLSERSPLQQRKYAVKLDIRCIPLFAREARVRRPPVVSAVIKNAWGILITKWYISKQSQNQLKLDGLGFKRLTNLVITGEKQHIIYILEEVGLLS